MKNQLLFCSALCLVALTSCEQPKHTDNVIRNQQNMPNGMLNDQAENDADRAINQKIRQALVEDVMLSPHVKTIRIITANGIVTLRGTVFGEKEKNEIAKRVKGVAGVKNVDNQIEIVRMDKMTVAPE